MLQQIVIILIIPFIMLIAMRPSPCRLKNCECQNRSFVCRGNGEKKTKLKPLNNNNIANLNELTSTRINAHHRGRDVVSVFPQKYSPVMVVLPRLYFKRTLMRNA